LPGGGSQSALGSRTASNPFKDTGMLLEAIEHVSAHFRDKVAHQIEDEES